MTTLHDIERLEKEIGGRIDAAVAVDPRPDSEIADLIGIGLDALNRIRKGQSTTQYAKLALLAEILHCSPNQLLGFCDGERQVLKGALGGAFEGLGYPLLAAQEIAAIVLKVIDTREVGDPAANQRERARLIAKFLTQQFVDSQHK